MPGTCKETTPQMCEYHQLRRAFPTIQYSFVFKSAPWILKDFTIQRQNNLRWLEPCRHTEWKRLSKPLSWYLRSNRLCLRSLYPACPTCPMECIWGHYSIGVKPFCLFHRGVNFFEEKEPAKLNFYPACRNVVENPILRGRSEAQIPHWGPMESSFGCYSIGVKPFCLCLTAMKRANVKYKMSHIFVPWYIHEFCFGH